MFGVGNPQVLASTNNTGTATLDTTISNLSDLTTDDYKLSYSGTAWEMQDTSTGASVALTGTGTSADPLEADGMSIVVNGTPNAGDNFVINPTAGAVDGMSVLLTSPSQVAAASLGTASAATTAC